MIRAHKTLTVTLLAALPVVVLALAPAATAQTVLYVDDDAPGDPGPGDALVSDPLEDGSPEHPFDAIQEAIDAAIDNDEIVVAPGTYLEAIDFLAKAMWLHSADGPDVTIIDGTGNSHVVQSVSGEGPDTVLEGFTITGGDANGGSWPNGLGGGILLEQSSPTIHDCTFSANAASWGGGMCNYRSSPTVSNCTFAANTASSRGGGIYNVLGSPTVTGCTFSGNSASGDGGGMLNVGSGSPTVTDCTFSENTAGSGGGMHNWAATNPTITNCTFHSNTATVRGGGMHNVGHSALITNCSFVGNHAGFEGGGLYNNAYRSSTITDCVFVGNHAGTDGGGMYNIVESPTITNCALVGNWAESAGGAMYNWGAAPGLRNCTLTANSSLVGGAMFNRTGHGHGPGEDSIPSRATLLNCVVWNNLPDEIFDDDDHEWPSITTVHYSDIAGGWAGAGANNIDADPMFVDPENGDLRLSAGSPCIDAGNNNAIADLAESDLDGGPRFADDLATPDTGCGVPVVVDMGAYEHQGQPAEVRYCDLNADGSVGIVDFLMLLGTWGPCAEGCWLADLDLDGEVGDTDFQMILANWG
ncbi:MAG: NosD domain-containing protein [Planctomycetota bacterium]